MVEQQQDKTVKCKILKSCFLPEGMRVANPHPSHNDRKMLTNETHNIPIDHAKLLDDLGLVKLVWDKK